MAENVLKTQNNPLLLTKRQKAWEKVKNRSLLYALLSPAFISTIIFGIMPLVGLIVMFKDFDMVNYQDPFIGMFTSPWAEHFGMGNFIKFLSNELIWPALLNTILLAILGIIISPPFPIALALLFNELRVNFFKKFTQTVSYLPHFLSIMTVLGLVMNICSKYGPINDFMMNFGLIKDRIILLQIQELFIPIILITQIWVGTAWGSILYLAGIANADPQLYDAAKIDGATRMKQMFVITLPCIVPMFVISMIFSVGGILSSNFALIYGLQNPKIDFETLDTLVYKMGMEQGDFTLSAALGFTKGMIGLALTLGVNWFAKKISGIGVY